MQYLNLFFIPGTIISAITFPGVVVHEYAHKSFCELFNVPVHEVCYYRYGNPAGYVIHEKCDFWYQDVIIALGPFFLNTSIGLFLGFLGERLISSIPEFLSIFIIWLSVSIAMHAIPSKEDGQSMWKAVSGNKAPLIAKIVASPIIAIVYLMSWGSMIWLDAVYGIIVCFLGPSMFYKLLT